PDVVAMGCVAVFADQVIGLVVGIALGATTHDLADALAPGVVGVGGHGLLVGLRRREAMAAVVAEAVRDGADHAAGGVAVGVVGKRDARDAGQLVGAGGVSIRARSQPRGRLAQPITGLVVGIGLQQRAVVSRRRKPVQRVVLVALRQRGAAPLRLDVTHRIPRVLQVQGGADDTGQAVIG